MDYKEAGVDVDKGNEASKILYSAAKESFSNRDDVVVGDDSFSGLRGLQLDGKDMITCLGFDGIGSKVKVAEELGKHDTLAYDLFAMVCDDAIVKGGEPIAIGTVLDVSKVDLAIVKELAKGYVNAAKEAGVVILNGELAELGSLVGGKYNWSAGVLWKAHKDKVITGKKIRPGDAIVMLREEGFRSNGFTLARKFLPASELITPSTIYTRHFLDLYGRGNERSKAEIHGVAHITGGGIPEKLGRVLHGYGAKLDNLFPPAKGMEECVRKGHVSLKEAYNTWNMGQGLAIITPEPERIIEHFVSRGIDAKNAGVVTDKDIVIGDMKWTQ